LINQCCTKFKGSLFHVSTIVLHSIERPVPKGKNQEKIFFASFLLLRTFAIRQESLNTVLEDALQLCLMLCCAI